jgi:hypothetical protein
MSMQAGTYKGKLIGASLGVIGEKNTPVLKMEFKPHSFLRGSVFIEGEFRNVDKLYFLSTELAKTGKNAGQSRIEILRKDLAETYGHSGGLTEESLAKLVGSTEFELVVELNDKGYPQVKWVNKPGGKKMPTKALPPDFLAKLQAAFLGEEVKVPAAAGADFWQGVKADA